MKDEVAGGPVFSEKFKELMQRIVNRDTTWAKAIISIIALLVTIILTFTSCSASYMLHKKRRTHRLSRIMDKNKNKQRSVLT
jgi:hypothetical protein